MNFDTLEEIANIKFGELSGYKPTNLVKNDYGDKKEIITEKDMIGTPGNIAVTWAPPLDILKMLKDNEVIESVLPEIRLQNQRSNLVCRFWEMGKCQLGDLCTFKHSYD